MEAGHTAKPVCYSRKVDIENIVECTVASVGNRLSDDTYYRPVVNGKKYGKFTIQLLHRATDQYIFIYVHTRLSASDWWEEGQLPFVKFEALSKLSCKFLLQNLAKHTFFHRLCFKSLTLVNVE